MLSDNFGRGYIQLYIYIYINLPYDNILLLLKKSVLYADLRMLDTFLMNENVFNQVNL